MNTAVLTSAELSFLLQDAPEAARRLDLPADDTGEAKQSGLASLVARDLLRVDNSIGLPCPELLPLLDALISPQGWFEIAFTDRYADTAVQFFDGPAMRIGTVTGRFGTHEFGSVDGTNPLGVFAREFVCGALEQRRPCAAVLTTSGEADGLALLAKEDGSYEIAEGDLASATLQRITLAEATARITRYVDG